MHEHASLLHAHCNALTLCTVAPAATVAVMARGGATARHACCAAAPASVHCFKDCCKDVDSVHDLTTASCRGQPSTRLGTQALPSGRHAASKRRQTRFTASDTAKKGNCPRTSSTASAGLARGAPWLAHTAAWAARRPRQCTAAPAMAVAGAACQARRPLATHAAQRACRLAAALGPAG